MPNKKTVVIAMSGGIDSGVAAAILKKRGYNRIGVHLKLWHDTDKIPQLELKMAEKIANHLKIPFHVVDFSKTYKEKVVDYYLDTYKICRTPNPCIKCNKYIKFGLLLKEAKKLGADYLATGHYVRLKNIKGKYHLFMAKDKEKDQSYFLYTLTQEKLKYLKFPIGDFYKDEIRKLAEKFGLRELKEIPESQGVCFLPETRHKDFLKKYLRKKKGPIKTGEGKIIGEHEGLFLYTIGQRKGIKIGGEKEPWFVKKLDYKNNALVVGKKAEIYQKELGVKNISFISGTLPKLPLKIEAKIRYRALSKKAVLTKEGRKFIVKFKETVKAAAPGQAVVFYKGQEVLGGGVIA